MAGIDAVEELIKQKNRLLEEIEELKKVQAELIDAGSQCRHGLQRIAEISSLKLYFPGAPALVAQWDRAEARAQQ